MIYGFQIYFFFLRPNHPESFWNDVYQDVYTEFHNKPKFKIIRKSSKGAIKQFPNRSLDFVYIDADHSYKECKWDISHWMKKVRVGGILSGHNYGDKKGVKKAVDELIPNKIIFGPSMFCIEVK